VSIGRINRTKGIALAAITSTAVAAGVILIQGAADADPKPTMDQAKKQVAALQHQAEVAGESANELRGQIDASSQRVKALEVGIAKQQAQVDQVKRQIGSLAVAGYQTSGISTTAQLLLSQNPDQFLSQASTAQAFAGQQNSALRRFQLAQGKLTDLQASEQTELKSLQAVQAKQDAFKKQIQTNLDAAQKVLGKLTDDERRKIAEENAQDAEDARNQRPSRDGDRMDDIGDIPAMYAWGKAGVSLSHSSKAQMSEGRRVSKSELMPGDLVFFYQPVSHVAMYIGNGRIVHAPRPGTNVRIASLDEMPYSGAVRPG
jgi:hypothetical protein